MYLPAVVLRVVILYLFAFVLLRLMGKRENKQLTMFDAVVIVILGDLIGTPTIDFQLPMVLAMLALGVFITLERIFIALIQHSQRLENIIESKPALLVEEGRVNLRVLKKEKFGLEELYSNLRLRDISNLGQVQRVFLENSGNLSVFRKVTPANGLSILPAQQGAPTHYRVDKEVMATDQYFCYNCGDQKLFSKGLKFSPCIICHGKEWVSPEKGRSAEQ